MPFFENKWPAILLLPFSLLYGITMAARNFCYDHGFLKSHRLRCPVISVGNITVGGTGKTPTVAFLAKYLLGKGKKVCILSRGYGRTSHGPVVVSDGNQMLASVQEAGDEPYLLAKKLPDVPVIADRNRVQAGQMAVSLFNPDVIFLDDGFQHRRLHRDLDIVTFKSSKPLGNGLVLPAGPLREFVHNLKRADCLWINGKDSYVADIAKRIGQGQQLITARYSATGIIDAHGGQLPVNLFGTRVVAFCGLANPSAFKNSLEEAGAVVEQFLTFPDHHFYSIRDVERIKHTYEESRAEIILTTEKDWVKLPKEVYYDARWKFLAIEIITNDLERLDAVLDKLFAPARAKHP